MDRWLRLLDRWLWLLVVKWHTSYEDSGHIVVSYTGYYLMALWQLPVFHAADCVIFPYHSLFPTGNTWPHATMPTGWAGRDIYMHIHTHTRNMCMCKCFCVKLVTIAVAVVFIVLMLHMCRVCTCTCRWLTMLIYVHAWTHVVAVFAMCVCSTHYVLLPRL